jgi:hypothetical protein
MNSIAGDTQSKTSNTMKQQRDRVKLKYRKLPPDENGFQVAATAGDLHHCDLNYEGNEHLINPKTDPPTICSGDKCDPVMNQCVCKPEHFGDVCQYNKYEHIAFDLDCTNMDEEYVSSCLRQTHGGSCPHYRLVWDRLCYRTCTALPGLLCTPFVRQSYCANSPECPGLCNDLLETYCTKAAAGKKEEETATIEKLASPSPSAEDTSKEPTPDNKDHTVKKDKPKYKCINGKKSVNSDTNKKRTTF